MVKNKGLKPIEINQNSIKYIYIYVIIHSIFYKNIVNVYIYIYILKFTDVHIYIYNIKNVTNNNIINGWNNLKYTSNKYKMEKDWLDTNEKQMD